MVDTRQVKGTVSLFMYAVFTNGFIKPRINRNIEVLFKKVSGVEESSFPLPRFIS